MTRPATRRARTRERAWYDSPWRILIRALGIAVATLLVALIAALLLIPRLMGGQALTVLTGSMEPALSPGDVVAVRGIDPDDVCTEVSVNDIVTFLPAPDDPSLITHRVVGITIGSFEDGSGCRLLTQGDANSTADDPISPEQVRGVFMYAIPSVGWVKEWIQQNPMLAMALGIAIAAVWWLWPGRQQQRTVVRIPGVASMAGSGSSTPVGTPQATSSAPDELALRRRELDLRERELLLRERELSWAMGSVDPDSETSPPATQDTRS
ncbi:signal peptidase I [Microbacterium stercoris]|uniref:Signal peptidase I n=1 Tax=Microbacterium stercoris TaxID=2820289 RepID=A0A939QKP9_9MICO|nr:signal peptidase I [Microbacterium stercoris]MBO3663935.1 signal peptidase I [Microbacterium stercoris]